MRIEPPASLCSRCRWYDVIGVAGRNVTVSYRSNRLYSVAEKESSGCGVRVNVDGRVGFSYSGSDEGVERAMRRAIEIAPYGDEEDYELPGPAKLPSVKCDSGRLEELDEGPIHSGAEEAIARIIESFPEAHVDLGISFGSGQRRIINSSGFDGSYRHSSFGVGITATIVSTDGVVQAGAVPVVCTPKAFASLLGIVSSGISARSVFKGISPFAGKLGSRVFSEEFSLSDDPLADGSVYSYPFDDEGVPARTKKIIDRGVITEWVSNLKYAARLGVSPSGNGSRGHASLPGTSLSTVAVDGGKDGFESLVSGVRGGVLVDQFIGLGQSNTLTGEFKANLDLAYALENGEIAGRVKDCMLGGNLFELLSSGPVFSRERVRYGAALVPFVLFPSVNLIC